jgi:hypothetical protein
MDWQSEQPAGQARQLPASR